jgi:perosamine synthetase
MMHYFRRVISASLSPNTERADVWLAFRLFFSPWKWRRGNAAKRVEEWFERKYPGFRAASVNSGRSALFAILKAFDIGAGDEVLIQAFTCVAVPNSVLWTEATPIYVDVDKTLNIDINDAEGKVTKRTRAIVVQHTFGVPADMGRIVSFAKKHELLLIEDCAHALGAHVAGRPVGGFGDASFFSFGRDKAISSVFGGLALIHEDYGSARKKLKNIVKVLPYPPFLWILQELLHPIVFAFVLPFYNLGLGKLILVICQRLHLLSFPVYQEEKSGQKPSIFPTRYPNALAQMAYVQLKKLDRLNEKRRKTVSYYQTKLKDVKGLTLFPPSAGATYLRFPLLASDPARVIRKAKQNGILLGNWYRNVIDPAGVEYSSVFYTAGSCPEAEQYARHVINLPTLISEKQAARVVKQLSKDL